MQRVGRAPVPIVVVAGPRGAGKTTLINCLLADPAFADTTVVLNDFGATALSGGVVETAENTFVALGGGCLCCAVRGGLTDPLEKLIRDLDNGRIDTLARIVIEADETADPAALLGSVWAHPYLAMRFAAGSIVAVLDAARAATLLAARDDTVRQVAVADLIALSPVQSEEAVRLVHRLNPFAAVVDAASVTPAAIAGLSGFDAVEDANPMPGTTAVNDAPLAGEAARVSAFVATRERSMPFAALDRMIEYLAVVQRQRLMRVRGIVSIDDGEAVAVSGAGPFYRPPVVVPREGSPAIRFAVTASDVDADGFDRILDAFLGEARIDSPDATALRSNPLAVPGFSARSGS